MAIVSGYSGLNGAATTILDPRSLTIHTLVGSGGYLVSTLEPTQDDAYLQSPTAMTVTVPG